MYWYGKLICLIIFAIRKRHRFKQTKHIRFLQVRIQKKRQKKCWYRSYRPYSTNENNIEKWIKFTKIFILFIGIYALYLRQIFQKFFGDLKYRLFGGDYISMELFVEKEQIKYIVWVPDGQLSTVRKMIATFIRIVYRRYRTT